MTDETKKIEYTTLDEIRYVNRGTTELFKIYSTILKMVQLGCSLAIHNFIILG